MPERNLRRLREGLIRMGKHRRMSSTSKKFAALGAAAITTTALTVAVVPDSPAIR